MLRAAATPAEAYALARGAPTVLGRGFADILDGRLSRDHVRLTEADGGYLVHPLGRNGVLLCEGGSSTVLKPGDEALLRYDAEICLLPGGEHRFRLVPSEPAAAVPEPKRQRSSDVPPAVTSSSSSDADEDWASLTLPPFAQPPKPTSPAGLDALTRLAMTPETHLENIYLLTREFVVAYDLYPKGQVHLLILPRGVRIQASPAALDASHAPLVRRMASLGEHLARMLRRRSPSLAPFAMGFHAVPSMRQLHLHVISTDLDSSCLKSKKHWNSFATRFLLRPAAVAAQLESPSGKASTRGHAAEEASLKNAMRCPLTGATIKDMPALKVHVATPSYANGLRALDSGADVVLSWPRWEVEEAGPSKD